MTPEYPPELKGFHAKNMLHALFVFMIPAIAGSWAFYRQEAFAADDNLQSALGWFFMGGVGAFMITILNKALVTLPKCPECSRKMKQEKAIDIPDKAVLGMQSSSKWRIVHCPHCDTRYRVPGLSQE